MNSSSNSRLSSSSTYQEKQSTFAKRSFAMKKYENEPFDFSDKSTMATSTIRSSELGAKRPEKEPSVDIYSSNKSRLSSTTTSHTFAKGSSEFASKNIEKKLENKQFDYRNKSTTTTSTTRSSGLATKKIEREPSIDINESAEAFINKFKRELMIQRLDSIENYKQMLERGL